MRTPKLRFHKASKRYYVALNGKFVYLGKDRADAEAQYHRMMLEYTTTGGQSAAPVAPEDMLVCECIEKYARDRDEYYASNPDSFERGHRAMRYLNRGFGHYKKTKLLPCADFCGFRIIDFLA